MPRWRFRFPLVLPAFALAAVGLLHLGAVRAAAAQASHNSPAADAEAGQAWWAHVQALADDANQGRLTGSPGYMRAAGYVVDKFKSYGLQPAGVNGGFLQPVHFEVQRVIAEKSSLALTGSDGKTQTLTLGKDAILGTRSPGRTVDAPLVFVGYGLHLPSEKYDDFDSPEVPLASLRGKIVVYINGGPAELSGALKSFARTSPLQKVLTEAGVVGTISIPTPKSMDFGWGRVASSASQPGMWLAPQPGDAELAKVHPALADEHTPRMSATFNPAEAEKLFAGTAHTFSEVLALADAQKPLPRFALGKNLKATAAVEHATVESPNIVARLGGSDPQLKGEYVLVSAHLDHLGVGAPIGGRTIYSGAMDDASGVATVLETAKVLSERAAKGDRPRRTLLFVIFTAEEKGLLGSRYFAGHPTVPGKAIDADLNLDMFMPLFPFRKLHVQGLEQSTLRADAEKVGTAHGILIAGDPEPDRNSFIRTDQYSFVQAGVPALAMKFGWTMGSPEYRQWRAWLAERYHSTADNLDQPKDLVAAAQFNSFFADLVRAVSDDPARQHYLPTSFFHRFEVSE